MKREKPKYPTIEGSKINIEVVTIDAGPKATTETVARSLELAVQERANHGWTLRTATSRGGSFYLVFARKGVGEPHTTFSF